MAGVLFACLVLSFLRPFTLIGAPFLLLFALGYSGVGLLRLLDQYATRPTPVRSAAAPWLRPLLARFAVGTVGIVLLAGIAATALALAVAVPVRSNAHARAGGARPRSDHRQLAGPPADSAQGRIDRPSSTSMSNAVRWCSASSWTSKANEGEIVLDLEGAMLALGDSLGKGRQLAFNVEYSSRFTGEFQAFVKDRKAGANTAACTSSRATTCRGL